MPNLNLFWDINCFVKCVAYTDNEILHLHILFSCKPNYRQAYRKKVILLKNGFLIQIMFSKHKKYVRNPYFIHLNPIFTVKLQSVTSFSKYGMHNFVCIIIFTKSLRFFCRWERPRCCWKVIGSVMLFLFLREFRRFKVFIYLFFIGLRGRR